MERRVLLAIFLSFLVLYLYQAFVVKPVPLTPPAANVAVPAQTAGPATSGVSVAREGTSPAAAAQPAATQATALVGGESEREIRVETREVTAVFTSRGARLKSWRLRNYFSQNSREPLDLVVGDLGGSQPLPFSVRVDDPAVTSQLNGALFSVHGAPSGNAAESSATDLAFEYRDSDGVHAVKTFHFEPASFVVAATVSVTKGDRTLTPTIEWGPALGDVGNEASRYIKKAEGLLFTGGKVQRLAAKDVASQPVRDGDFRYAGVDDHYFMAVALFPGGSKMTYQPVAVPPADPKGTSREYMSFAITPSQAPVKFFVGPKDFDVLSGIDRDLVRAIDFGIFAVLVVPLLRALEWINRYVGNYGWSIILLTVFINAVMFPLRHKSVVSMRKMQEIQPEVKAIQERYAKFKATDPAKQKMNQEMMALYKERGVNPASGCVPMLLTLPVLFAMWSMLSTAIELRGAPFFGWIHDLSIYDPLYIAPILMGISQVWQQKITPATGADPAQQKMMMFMPVVFTFMFLWAPAGLAIYYGVTNLWGIGQQYLTNYLIGPPNIRTVRPPAERRVKRAGEGKSDAAAKREQTGSES